MAKIYNAADYADILATILAKYHKAHNLQMVPIKIDHLKPMMIERGVADQIYWEKVEFEHKFIGAMVEFYQSIEAYKGDIAAKITYASSLNECWQRFVLCKEMYHCVIDNDTETRTSNPGEVSALLEELGSPVMPGRSKKINPNQSALDTEYDAELLAVETLFPLELRKHHMHDYNNQKISSFQIALRYKIPEVYIAAFMKPRLMALSEKTRGGKLLKF
jgi:hypothetical protein